MSGHTSTSPPPGSLHVWITSFIVFVFALAIVGPLIGLPLHRFLFSKDLDLLFDVSGVNAKFILIEFFLFLSSELVPVV
jgi:hypothetical protein